MENNCFGQGMIFVLPEKYDKIETEINFGIVDFWYADEMKTEQNFRLDW